MELGGNAPFLVFDDADVDEAVDGAMIAKMRNVGEACTSANRFHVHESLADEFAEKLTARMAALKVGRGTEEETDVGPLIDGDQRSKVAELVEDAVSKGAEATVGGSAVDGAGYFYEPTVLKGVSEDAKVLERGDLRSGGADRDVLDRRGGDRRRQQDRVRPRRLRLHQRPAQRALRVCEALETGMIGLNQGMVSNAGAPFGGVKASGVGREGGNEGIHEYLETKYVAINI